jgi:hypothetical protein
VVISSPLSLAVQRSGVEGGDMLLPLGSPLPDDAVSAVRGDSGLLGGLSVPLVWGVAVPPDDYDHWAPEPDAGTDGEDAASSGLKSEDWQYKQWGTEAEPRFKVARKKTGVVPHSPAAG